MRTKTLSKIVWTLFIFTCFLTNSHAFQKEKDQFVVVLDAGHGGEDPGKVSKYGYYEKDIALKITLAVGAKLEKYPDIKVIYTRVTDTFIQLRDRPKIANKANADLFVSIHCNAHHTEASGTETYVLDLKNTNNNFEVAKAENEVIFFEEDYEKHYEGFDPHSPMTSIGITILQEENTEYSILLASYVERNFVNQLKRKSRGVKQASLWVIHQTAMPSILIETGFITNKKEGAYLNSAKGQKEVSYSIFDAITDYKAILDQNVGDEIYAQTTTTTEVETDKPIEKMEISVPEKIYTNIVFKIQLAASSTRLEPKPLNFNGLTHVSREKEDRLFKYFYGYTSDYAKIKRMQDEAQKKGYPDCFVVAYKDGQRIDLDKALKTTAN